MIKLDFDTMRELYAALEEIHDCWLELENLPKWNSTWKRVPDGKMTLIRPVGSDNYYVELEQSIEGDWSLSIERL